MTYNIICWVINESLKGSFSHKISIIYISQKLYLRLQWVQLKWPSILYWRQNMICIQFAASMANYPSLSAAILGDTYSVKTTSLIWIRQSLSFSVIVASLCTLWNSQWNSSRRLWFGRLMFACINCGSLPTSSVHISVYQKFYWNFTDRKSCLCLKILTSAHNIKPEYDWFANCRHERSKTKRFKWS
jgi:hypothetical protein